MVEIPIVIKNPIDIVFEIWKKSVEPVVGEGNFSVERSQTNTGKKSKYARIFMLGNPTLFSDLEADECATTISFQTESYASGQKSLSTAYHIDNVSHDAMTGMGFKRTYGPTEVGNSDKNYKRIISQYSMVYAGTLLNQQKE